MSTLKRFINMDYGIESVITVNKDGYSVVLKDTESQEYLPTIKKYPDDCLADAIKYAKSLVK